LISPYLSVYVAIVLDNSQTVRQELSIMASYVRTCKLANKDQVSKRAFAVARDNSAADNGLYYYRVDAATQLLKLIGSRSHLLDENTIYSLQDLADLYNGRLIPKMRRVISAFRDHILRCEVSLWS